MVIVQSAECSARPNKKKGKGQIEERKYINYTEQIKLVGHLVSGQQVSAQLWAQEGSLVVGAQSGAESRRWSVELMKVRSWGQAGLATGNPETQSRGHRRNREAGRFTRIKAKQTGRKQAGSEPGRQVEEKRTTLRNTLTIIATFQCETFFKQNVCA